MKIICLAKFIPDVENFIYDYEKNVLVRENVRMVINPDDASAISFALKIKNKRPGTFIEIVTMAPQGVIPQLEDLLRLNVDKATLISDRLYVGSDSYITSKILGKYLSGVSFGCILTGTHALDGDTSHVPAQIGEILKIAQMSNIVKIEEESFDCNSAVIEVDTGKQLARYKIDMPAALSLLKNNNYKLPFIKYKDMGLYVRDRIEIIDNRDIGFDEQEVGIRGSLTQVSSTFIKKMDKKNKLVVKNDEEGINAVFSLLKSKGYL
jgi:electron transfer flavoprotein beta subunit